MQNNELSLKVIKYPDLSEQELVNIVTLCSRAFNVDYQSFLNTFHGATHVLGYFDRTLVSHALWITRWLQVQDSPPMRTAYIEAVATDESYRNRGCASAVMRRIAEEIVDFDLGGLCTGSTDFYSRLGWQLWKGPLFIRKDSELFPAQENGVMILPLPETPELDLSASLSVEWREGEVW